MREVKRVARIRGTKLQMIADEWRGLSTETKAAVYEESPSLHYLMTLIMMEDHTK